MLWFDEKVYLKCCLVCIHFILGARRASSSITWWHEGVSWDWTVHTRCVCMHQFIIYGIFSLGATAAALLSSTQNAFSLGKYKRTKFRVEKKIYSLNWIVGIVQSSYFVILLYTNVLSSNYWRRNCSLMTRVHFFFQPRF